MTEEAGARLVKEYVSMRAMGASRKVVTATPRQLESLIRLSEAHARMRLSQSVEESDVAEAVRLMAAATQSAATDPTTGTIDMDMINTGRSAAQRGLVQQLAEALRAKFRSMSATSISVADVQRMVQEETSNEVETSKLREALAQLQTEGTIRMPRQNTVSVL